jgi:hypothetical protein
MSKKGKLSVDFNISKDNADNNQGDYGASPDHPKSKFHERHHKRANSENLKSPSKFGRSQRFLENPDVRNLPGPGFYSISLTEKALSTSKACKIGKSLKGPSWLSTNKDPGPGMYDVDNFAQIRKKISYGIKFGEGKRYDISSSEKSNMPAPGSYDLSVNNLSFKLKYSNFYSEGSHGFGYSNRFLENKTTVDDDGSSSSGITVGIAKMILMI